jgi:hypothetical protein
LSLLEKACEETERKASELSRASKHLGRIAARLLKAATSGDHGAIVGAAAELKDAATAVQAATQLAQQAWPFDDDQLTAYLLSKYQTELVRSAATAGVNLVELDDRLAAFPAVIQIQPTQRSVRINAQRVTALRPSILAKRIAEQRKKAGAKPQQFIELLHAAYKRAVATSTSGATLADIYELLTLHPEARRAYSRAEFARDLFLLDTSGVRSTRSGATISLYGSTTTKGGRGVFQVVPDDGMPKYYAGIRFQEAAK